METSVKLDHKVSLKWLLFFAMPTILSSIFSSLYTTVDGIFVARRVNTDALSAINITMPLICLASTLGMMFGSGGNALVAKKLGEGKRKEAQEDCFFLGSDQALIPYCRQYMVPVLISLPFAVFGMVFQLSFIIVGKAGLGAFLSVMGGVLNMVLDWLFMSVFGWGLAGAAIATSIGYALPSVAGVIWFSVKRDQILHIVRPKWRPETIVDSCINGSSEMVSVLAFSVIAILFNNILMRLGGSDGVASLTIIWYAQGFFGGLFRGYINGISAVVSYNLGCRKKERLSKLFRISIWTLGVLGILATVISYLAGDVLVGFFAKDNAQVEAIALHGFDIVATSFLMMAYNIFASGWFTALNDGKTSAILSFCRTILFMVVPVLILPRLFGMDGVWMSITAGEVLSIGMGIYYFVKYREIWSEKMK